MSSVPELNLFSDDALVVDPRHIPTTSTSSTARSSETTGNISTFYDGLPLSIRSIIQGY